MRLISMAIRLSQEKKTLRGPYIVCSRAHLNAIDDSPESLAADYVLYQDINLGTAAEGGDGGDDGKNFTPIAGALLQVPLTGGAKRS